MGRTEAEWRRQESQKGEIGLVVSDNLLVALIIAAAIVWVSLTLQKSLDQITERLAAIEERLGIRDDDNA